MARRASSAWRTLFAPARLSPAVETFLVWLAATPYRWQLRADGKLRAGTHAAEMCAITAVVRHRTGRLYSPGDWVRAAASIGISYADAGLIVEAADHAGSLPSRVNLLRTRLLGAAHVDSPVAPLPVPDAMDRALADLVAAPEPRRADLVMAGR